MSYARETMHKETRQRLQREFGEMIDIKALEILPYDETVCLMNLMYEFTHTKPYSIIGGDGTAMREAV